jgi:hypothetical protein
VGNRGFLGAWGQPRIPAGPLHQSYSGLKEEQWQLKQVLSFNLNREPPDPIATRFSRVGVGGVGVKQTGP